MKLVSYKNGCQSLRHAVIASRHPIISLTQSVTLQLTTLLCRTAIITPESRRYHQSKLLILAVCWKGERLLYALLISCTFRHCNPDHGKEIHVYSNKIFSFVMSHPGQYSWANTLSLIYQWFTKYNWIKIIRWCYNIYAKVNSHTNKIILQGDLDKLNDWSRR